MTRKFLVLVAVAACVVAAGCKQESAPGPDVWAVVNGKNIQRADVEKFFRTRVNAQGPAPSQEEALSLKLSILDELVNNEILLERATKLGLLASDAEVEDKFTESKSSFTEEDFARKLQTSGLSVDDLKSDLRRQLSVQKLLNREVVAKISITDQDVIDFYNKNRAQFNVVEPQFHIAQIVVTPHPDATVHNRQNDKATSEPEAKHKVESLEQKLASGADFSALAMDFSEDSTASTGGDLGFVPESALNQSDQNNEPIYTAAYGQLDASASYDINRHFSVFFSGINLTSEGIRQYGRFTNQFYSAAEGFARYEVGFRMKL